MDINTDSLDPHQFARDVYEILERQGRHHVGAQRLSSSERHEMYTDQANTIAAALLSLLMQEEQG